MNISPASARLTWGLLPAKFKRHLVKLEKTGLLKEAEPYILAEAEKDLKLLGRFSAFDCCHALELAAQHWLETREANHAQNQTA